MEEPIMMSYVLFTKMKSMEEDSENDERSG